MNVTNTTLDQKRLTDIELECIKGGWDSFAWDSFSWDSFGWDYSDTLLYDSWSTDIFSDWGANDSFSDFNVLNELTLLDGAGSYSADFYVDTAFTESSINVDYSVLTMSEYQAPSPDWSDSLVSWIDDTFLNEALDHFNAGEYGQFLSSAINGIFDWATGLIPNTVHVITDGLAQMIDAPVTHVTYEEYMTAQQNSQLSGCSTP